MNPKSWTKTFGVHFMLPTGYGLGNKNIVVFKKNIARFIAKRSGFRCKTSHVFSVGRRQLCKKNSRQNLGSLPAVIFSMI